MRVWPCTKGRTFRAAGSAPFFDSDFVGIRHLDARQSARGGFKGIATPRSRSCREIPMKHRSTEQLLQIAEVKPAEILTRRERLERWAELLERDPAAPLRTLDEIEWHPKAQRPSMRANGSPFSVAYADPVLRAAGLEGDTLGDAMRFFEMSEYEAHRVVCYCMHGRTVEGRRAANVVRSIAAPFTEALRMTAFAVMLPVICFVGFWLIKLV